jgi:hypothetical protein
MKKVVGKVESLRLQYKTEHEKAKVKLPTSKSKHEREVSSSIICSQAETINEKKVVRDSPR